MRARFSLLAAAGPLTSAVLLLIGLLVLWAAWRWLEPTPDKRLVIATGPEQGAYEDFGQRYLPLLQAHGLTVELRPTRGSSDNLALLRDPASGVHAAFVQGGAVDASAADADRDAAAPAGDASAAAAPARPAPGSPATLVSLGQVALEPLWLFYRADRVADNRAGHPAAAPGAPATRLADLAGWRIDTGPAGEGSGLLFRQLAQASGLPVDGLLAPERPAAFSVADLVQGKVDAIALVSAAEAPLLQFLLATPGVRLLDWSQAPALERRFAYLRALTLPRGTADLAADQPPQDLRLVATHATLAARADLHPALMQLLLQAAQQVHGQPGWFNRRGEFPHSGSDELPLAPEAERFYRSGPPWLQRYLPFWLANIVDRMWIVLLPLLAALLPLSRIVPPLVTLRLRSRVYRWYAVLRDIEKALEAPAPELRGLLARLEALDAQTEHIGLPLSFTNELYDLRGHIHLVRKRLLARQSGAAPLAAGTAGFVQPPAAPER